MAFPYELQSNDTSLLLSVEQLMSIGGENESLPDTYNDLEKSSAYIFMRRLQTVIIPVICVFGILGNVLAVGTFTSPVLFRTSCCWHLAAKSVFDIGFLLSLFVVWLYRLRVPLLLTIGVCQITVFLTYVCGCVSVWFVVVITVENFIRFTRGHLVQKYCTVQKAKRIVAVVTVSSALVYNFSLWTSGVVDMPDGSRQCITFNQFNNVVGIATMVDTALTLVFPSLIMFVLVVYIAAKSMDAFERKNRLLTVTSRIVEKRSTPEGRMTTFLFAISVIFFVMNTPSHGIRTKMVIYMYLDIHPSYSDHILHRIFEIFFYFNFSTNCLIYLALGQNFRAVFVSKYCSRLVQKYKTINSHMGRTSQGVSGLKPSQAEASQFKCTSST